MIEFSEKKKEKNEKKNEKKNKKKIEKMKPSVLLSHQE